MFCCDSICPGRYLVTGVAADDLNAWLFGESNSWVEYGLDARFSAKSGMPYMIDLGGLCLL